MTDDLEQRLIDALTARAQQVRPRDLTDRRLPTAPPRRRPVMLLAAAACLAAIAAGVVVAGLGGEEAPDPAPRPSDPEVVLPPDVGRDWPTAAVEPARLDLDGDGEADRVRFRGEPGDSFDGRLRLETRLSGGGSAYGVVDLGTTLYSYAFDPVDADGDGDEELVLAEDSPDGRSTVPAVLDLRDGRLVETPPARSGDAVLRGGAVRVDGAGTSDYAVDRAADWWVEDGVLRSSLSREGFASFGMDWYVPDPYVADVWQWRLGEDGVLRPETDVRRCLSAIDGDRPVCEPGQVDGLPGLSPVATGTVGAGETFEIADGLRSTVTVSEVDGRTVLDLDLDGRPARAEFPGVGVRVFTTPATAVFSDGVSLVVDQDADGMPDAYVSVVPGADGPITDRFTSAPDGGDTWLTEDGEVLSVTGPDQGAELRQWALGEETLFSVPIGRVCRAGESATDLERC